MADFQTTVELKAQTGQLNQKLNQVNQKLKGVSAQVRKTQGAFKRMTRKVSTGLTGVTNKLKQNKIALLGMSVALGAFVGKGVKALKEWEDGLAQIETLGVTGIGAISDELDAVRREFGISGAEATKGYYDIISAGAKQGAEAMAQLTAATKLAKAGNTDLAGAIDVVTSGMNIFGDNGETATTIVDQLFLAVKYGKTTVEELGQTFGFVAPVIDAAGLSMADYAASMATITAGGIKTKQATTGLKAVLSNLIKVTPKASKAAERLGIDFGVAALKSKGLVGVMQDIADKTGGSVTELGMLFDSIEAINAVAVLTSDTGLKTLTRNFDAMSDSAGTTEEALEKVKKTASYNFAKFNEGLSIMSRSVGASVVPSLLEMADALAPVVDFLSALITKHPGIIKITIAVVALGTALAFLGGPITLGIIATGVAIKALVDHFDLFADGGVAALEKIELVWDNFWAGFADKSLGESINHIFSGIGNWVETLLPEGGFTALWDTTKVKLSEFWTSVSDWFTTTDWKGLWAGTLQFVGSIWTGVSTALSFMWTEVTKWYKDTDWKGLWDGVLEFAGNIWTGIETALTLAWTSASKWFQTTNWKDLWTGTLEFAGDIWSGVNYALTAVWTGITEWFSGIDWKGLWYGTGPHGGGLLEFTGDIWQGIKDALSVAWTGITEWFSNTDWKGLWEGLLEFTGNVWDGIKVILDATWTSITKWFTDTDWKGLWKGTLEFTGKVWDGIKTILDAMWTSVTAWFTATDWKGLWTGVLEFTGNVWTGIESVLTTMWDSLTKWFTDQDWKGLWTGTLSFVGNVWTGVKSGLTKMWTSLTTWFGDQNWDGLWSGTLSFVGDIWTGIETVLDTMWTSITKWFTDADWKGLWSGVLEFTGDIWSSVSNKLVAAGVGIDLWFQTADWSKLWSTALGFAGDIWAGVKIALDAVWTGVTNWFTSVDWSGLWTGNSAGNPHSDSAGVLGFAGDIWSGVQSALTSMWTSLTAWFVSVDWKSLWKGTLEFTGKVWDGMKVILDDAWTSITNWFTTTDWKNLWNNTLQFSGEVWTGIKPILDDAWTGITGWFDGLDWKGVGESVKAGMKASFTGIGDIFAGVLGEEETIGGDRLAAGAVGIAASGKIVTKLWPILQKQFAVLSARIAGYLAPLGASVLGGPVAWIALGVVAAAGLTYAFWPQIKSFFTDMWDSVKQWFADLDWAGMWDGITDGLVDIGTGVIDTIAGWLVIDFSGVWDGLLESLKGIGGSITTYIKGLIPSLPTWMGGSGNADPAATYTAADASSYATGGFISGDGTGTSDSIPAMLSDGEFVINARSTKLFGPLLEAINAQKFAKGGRVGAMKQVQKFAAGGTVSDAKSYQFLQFEDGLFSMAATMDKFTGNMDIADPAVVKVTRQLEYLQKHTGNLNEEQVLQHDYATRINQALINLLPNIKKEAEVASDAAGAVKDLGDAAKSSAETISEEKNEWEGTAQSFTGPIKQALSSGGDIGDAFKSGIKGMLQRISSKLLDKAFAPLEAGIDSFINNMFSATSKMGGGGGGSFLSGLFGGGQRTAGGLFGGMMMSRGGMVPKNGMRPQYFAQGGMARGTDTVPAMLTPGEMVLNKDQQDMLGGSTTYNTYNLDISGNVDQRAIEQIRNIIQQSPNQVNQASQRGERARTGLRPSNRR